MAWSLRGKNTETCPIKTWEPHGFCLESLEASCWSLCNSGERRLNHNRLSFTPPPPHHPVITVAQTMWKSWFVLLWKGALFVSTACHRSLPSAVLGSGLTGKRGYIQSIIVSPSGGVFLLFLLHNSGVRQRRRTCRQEEHLTVRLSNSSAGLFMKGLPKWPSVMCWSVNLPVEMFSLPRSLWDVLRTTRHKIPVLETEGFA